MLWPDNTIRNMTQHAKRLLRCLSFFCGMLGMFSACWDDLVLLWASSQGFVWFRVFSLGLGSGVWMFFFFFLILGPEQIAIEVLVLTA